MPNASPNWQQALNDFNQRGSEFVVAPVENIYQRLNGDAKLLIFRDSAQRLQGVFMIYLPDEAYRIQTHGNYNPSTFTGIIVYTDVNGQALLSCRVVNGQIQKLYDATLTSGGASSRSPSGCLDILVPCGYVFVSCGNMRFCDCLTCGLGTSGGGGGAGVGGPIILVFGQIGNGPTGEPFYNFSYGNAPTSTTNGNSSSSGTGGGWGGGQPSSSLADGQLINALSANAWQAVKDNVDAKNLIKKYFRNRGVSNAEAIENNIDLVDGDAFSDYINLLTNDNTYFQANKAATFPQIETAAHRAATKTYLASSIENELRQLALNNSNLSNPGFQVFKNIIFKVIKKKIPDCIPGLGTLADLAEAYTAYQIGDYKTAALNIASAIVDVVPPAKLVKLAVNVADIALTVQRVAEPIIKLYNHFGTRFSHVFSGFFNTFDNLGLIDKLEISTSGNSVVNIDVFLDSRVTVDDFLNYFSGLVGTWQAYGGGKLRIDLGGGSDLFFYPRSTSGEVPSIQITIDGVKMKLRLR